MTLVLIGKGLVLGGWPSKIGVIWVYNYIYKSYIDIKAFKMRSFSKESLRRVHGHFGQLQYAEVHVAGGRTEGPVDFFFGFPGRCLSRTASMKIPPKLGTYISHVSFEPPAFLGPEMLQLVSAPLLRVSIDPQGLTHIGRHGHAARHGPHDMKKITGSTRLQWCVI